MPCIAHVVKGDRLLHYVVVYHADRRRVVVGDPAEGVRVLSPDEFKAIWRERVVLLLAPPNELPGEDSTHWMEWVAAYLKAEKTLLPQSIFLGMLVTGIGLLTAIFIQWSIDRFIPNREFGLLFLSGGVLAGLELLRGGLNYLRRRFLLRLNRDIAESMVEDFLDRILQLPARFFETRTRGDIAARIEDAVLIQTAVQRVLADAVTALMVVLGSVALLFVLAPSIGVLAAGVLPTYGYLLTRASDRVRVDQSRARSAYGRLQASYVDSLGGVEAIRAFNAQPTFRKACSVLNRVYQRHKERLGLTRARIGVGASTGISLLVTATLLWGAYLVMEGRLELGRMMAGYSLLAGALPSATRLADARIAVSEATAAAHRLFDLLRARPEPTDGDAVGEMRRIEIHRGTFRRGRDTPLLREVDLVLEPGRLLGLLGRSGSGKTTLARVITRAYPLTEGEVRVDGRPAEEIELEAYRDRVAIVPGDVCIFDTDLRQNLLLGRNDGSLDLALDRFRRFGLAERVEHLEEILDRRVGEAGRNLSSGERQLIGLARALVGEPSFLIVDEALSSIDLVSRLRIHKLLADYAREHAVLLISHDVETLMRCDRVLRLEGGRLVDRGRPEEVLAGLSEFPALMEADREGPPGLGATAS